MIVKLQSILVLLMLLALIPLAGCAPDEAMGRVVSVIDGDTIDVQLQEHDSRIQEDLIRVRIADVDCPEMDTMQGPTAKAYTAKWLQSNLVYLDLDDKRGTDPYDRWIAVIYLAGPDGSIDTAKNFNRMLVDANQACVWDFEDNEFSPAEWWTEGIPATACIKSDSSTSAGDWKGTSAAVSTGLFSGFGSDTSDQSSSSSYASSSGSFVGSVKSDKYHYPSCRWAEKINPSNEIWFSSPEDARAHGYVPCKVCSPP